MSGFKTSVPTNWVQISMAQEEFDALRTGAEVLEQDQHGIKVMRLPNGDMLKLFRVKRWWSSVHWRPYSLRFFLNAQKLAQYSIPTLRVKCAYCLPDPRWTAVMYHPLPGLTLRQVAGKTSLPSGLVADLGVFVANLHRQGIYFRSLPLGNIVQTPEGAFGLIDVADLAASRISVGLLKALRNFKHLCRLERDRACFGATGWQHFVKSYCEARRIGGRRYQWFSGAAFRLWAVVSR